MPFPTGVGLLNRWVADDLTGADGAPVASWPARAGGGVLGQSDTTEQPAVLAGANGLNGLKAVRFDGTDDLLDSTTALTDDVAQPITVYMVIKYRTNTATHQVLHGDQGLEVLFRSNGAADRYRHLWAGSNGRDYGTYPLNEWHVWTVVATGGDGFSYTDGTSNAGSGNIGTGRIGTGLRIGSHSSGGNKAAIDVAELAFCSGAHDAAARASVHSYVQDTYAITVSDYASGAATSFPIRRRPGRGLILR